MRKQLIIFLLLTFSLTITNAQTFGGNYTVDAATVDYTMVVRDIEQTVDGVVHVTDYDAADATYEIVVGWPVAGENALFEYSLPYFSVGDTAGALSVNLPTPEALALGGIGLNVDFNDDGTFIINDGSVYPTTATEECITTQVSAPVSENGTWTNGGFQPVVVDNNTIRYGWGITQSGVFANFEAPDMANHVEGVDYGLTDDGTPTAMPNWGYLEVDYAQDIGTEGNTPAGLNLGWTAHDGPGSALGIVSDGDPYYNADEEALGLLNGMLGRSSIPADTVTIGAMAYYAANVGDSEGNTFTLNVPTENPPIMFGGPGQIDPTTGQGVVDPNTGSNVGVIDTSWGYIFDPTGDLLGGGDGVPFSGDEALKFTGYYATWNTLITLKGIESGVYAAALQGHTTPATLNIQGIVDSVLSEVLYNWGFDDASYAVLTADQNNNNIADVSEAVVGYVTGWLGEGDDLETIGGKLLPTILGFVTQTQATMTANGSPLRHDDESDYYAGDGTIVVVDDSGHDLSADDFNPYYDEPWNYVGGRLYVQVNANCFPVAWTQRINTHWTYTGATSAVEDGDIIANKFELKGNYPNPFNPTTKIRFTNDRTSNVKVTVYSLVGEKVATIMNKQVNAGTYDVSWNGRGQNGNIVSSGMYLYNVESEGRSLQGKMLFLK